MGTELGESTSREPNEPSVSANSSNNNDNAGNFECNICLELAQDPIVTLCGHLFCWPCLYKWIHVHAHYQECPVCKALIEEEKLVPLYGRRKISDDPRSRSIPGYNISNHPTVQRLPTRSVTAPHSDPSLFADQNPWLGAAPVGSTWFGSHTFSAALGGLFPYLNFNVHGLPGSADANFSPHGYAHNTFHGCHAHGFHEHPSQSDVYLKPLLLIVGAHVVAILVFF